MVRFPSVFGHLLGVADLAMHGAVEVALVGEPASHDFRMLSREVAAHYVPTLVLAGGPPGEGAGLPLLADRATIEGRAAAYVCRHFVCEAPVTTPQALGEQLERAAGAPLERPA